MGDADEVAALDRILTRLAVSEDDALQTTLQKLLPLVIEKLSTQSPNVRAKVLELLGHVNKRLKAAKGMRLPLLPLVRQATGAPAAAAPGAAQSAAAPPSAPMVRSFGLVYAEMAVERAEGEELLQALPLLLDGISSRPPQHAAIALRCTTAALAALGPPASASQSSVTAAASGVAGGPTTSHLLPPSTADRTALLDHLTRVLLYQRPTSSAPATPLAAAAAAAPGAAAAAAAADAPPPPPGLSAADAKAFEEKGLVEPWELVRRKMGALALIAGATEGSPVLSAGASGGASATAAAAGRESSSGGAQEQGGSSGGAAPAGPVLLTPSEVLVPLLVAACDPSEPVSRKGEALVRRLCGVEGSKPSVDLEDTALAAKLMGLVLGGGDETGPTVATPVGPALAARVMGLLVRSVAAAQRFPDNAKVLSACLYGPGNPSGASALGAPSGGAAGRLRAQGMEWCVWVIRHAPQHQLKAMAPTLLARLLPATGGEAPASGGGGEGDAMDVDAPSKAGSAGGVAPTAAAAAPSPATGGGGAQEAAVRGWAYQAVAALAQRLPEHFEGDVSVARRFFGALASEPAGSRAALQEAVGSLAGAYAAAATRRRQQAAAAAAAAAAATSRGGASNASNSVADEAAAAADAIESDLQELLMGALGSDQAAVRLCAIQWFTRLFPPHHAPSRYACAIAAGDPKPEIRHAGLRGLGLAPGGGFGPLGSGADFPSSATNTPTPGATVGSSSPSGAAVLNWLYPHPSALLAVLASKHPVLSGPADPNRPLPLPDRSLEALVEFLGCCRVAAAAAAAGSSGGHAPPASTGGAKRMDTDGGAKGAAAGEEEDSDIAYTLLLEHAACRVAPRLLLSAALEATAALTAPGGGHAPATAAAAMAAADTAPAAPEPDRREAAALIRTAAAVDSAAIVATAAASAHRITTAEERCVGRLPWLRELLAHTDGAVRTAAARLVGAAASALCRSGRSGEAAALLTALLAAATSGAAAPATTPAAAAAPHAKLEEQEGSVLAAGFIAAQCRASLPAAALQDAASRLSSLLPAFERHPIVAGAAALALGYMGATGPLPDVATPSDDPTTSDAAAAEKEKEGAKEGAAAAKEEQAPPPPGAVLVRIAKLLPTKAVVGQRDGGGAAAAALARATLAVGLGCRGETRPEVLRPAVKALLGLSNATKSEELLLVAGEALALAFGGVPIDTTTLLRSPASRLSDLLPASPEEEDTPNNTTTTGAAAAAAAEAVAVDGAAAAPATEPQYPWLQEEVLTELQGPLALNSRPEVRCAAAVWLVSLLSYCRAAPLLGGEERLGALQGTFTALLGDSNETTQETAARGVSLVYSLGGDSLRARLLSQLVGVLQGTNPGAASVSGVKGATLTGDTKIFEEGALGSVPGGGGLSTYRELAALASDMGQPELIYRFMDLARHASAANTSRGAAAGMAGIARLLGGPAGGGKGGAKGGGSGLSSLLGAERMGALLPRLYRQQYDPSPKVSEAMGAIWASLVDDTRAALDAHFDAIAVDLLREMGGRTWKGRQGAAAALADLLQGRRWDQLGPHICEMWSMTLRALDDVKESVRRTAGLTARTLRGTSLRLMDTSQTPARDVAACCAALLPLLMETGLPSNVPEVRALSLDVLTQAVRSAGPGPLLPLAPALVPGLLEALSGLEDARLNYLEQHAQRIGGEEAVGALEGARLAAARTSPLSDALDLMARCVASDPTGAAPLRLVPELTALVRRGVGINTKAGTAAFIRSLAQSGALAPQQAAAATGEAESTGDAKKEGGNGTAAGAAAAAQRSPVPQLLKALRSAVASERSPGVRKAYAAAAAAVAAKAGPKRLSKFVGDALAAYGASPNGEGESSGGSGDEGQRLAGALLLRELMRATPDGFNRHASEILPVAFLGKMDESSDVAAAWGAVWEEGAPSEGAALRMHAGELAALLAGGLKASSWGRKKACAEALSSMCTVAGESLSPHAPSLAAVLLSEGATGRLWDGKEALLSALGALAKACPAALSADPGAPRLAAALLAAAARRRTAYRAAALGALEQMLTGLAEARESSDKGAAGAKLPAGSEGVYAAVAPPLLEAIAKHVEPGPATKPKTPEPGNGGGAAQGGDEDGPPPPMPLAECLRCLAAAWRVAPPAVRADGGGPLFAAFGSVMARPGLPWTAWLAAVTAADDALRASAAAGGGGCQVSWLPPLLRGLLHCLTHSTVSQLRQRTLEAMGRALDAAESAAATTDGPALVAALQAAEAAAGGPAAPVAAGEGDGEGAAEGGEEGGGMEVDVAPLGQALAAGLQGVMEHEPAAALKTAAAGLLKRLG